MLAHLQWPLKKDSADIGVTAFFVLSGYLITSILVRERRAHRPDRLGRLLPPRVIARLGPALLGVLAFALVFGSRGPARRVAARDRLDTPYFSNWVQAAGIAIHPLGHTWSLAIEEQFYLLWPLVLIVAVAAALWIALALSRSPSPPGSSPPATSSTSRPSPVSTPSSWAACSALVAAAMADLGRRGRRRRAHSDERRVRADQHDLAVPAAMVATALVIGGRLPRSDVWPPSACGPTACTCGTRR